MQQALKFAITVTLFALSNEIFSASVLTHVHEGFSRSERSSDATRVQTHQAFVPEGKQIKVTLELPSQRENGKQFYYSEIRSFELAIKRSNESHFTTISIPSQQVHISHDKVEILLDALPSGRFLVKFAIVESSGRVGRFSDMYSLNISDNQP